ncbi:MAG: UDP-N-acetylmuramyl-tripeptide synthetase [bacterium]|nr:UDP-N-acetylmuramyl-tripeptide synthetase [bacterium]
MYFEKLKRKFQPLINIYHLFIAILANFYYGFPSRKLTIIGISGTDGKTTTTHLVHHVLKLTSNKVIMTSSISTPGLHVTTPNPFTIQKLIKKAVLNNCKYFIIETTSHALDQNRLWGIKFDVSAITNITFEHLDYHKNYINYLKTKAKLVCNSKVSILNKDDQSYEMLSDYLKKKNKKFLTYSLKNKADFNFDHYKELQLNLPLFNKYNYLTAYSILRTLKVPDDEIKKGFKSFILPHGRFEKVYDKKFQVYIDFAHTPNAFKAILNEFSKLKTNRLIHVFGSAGWRDNQKRQLMGKISSDFADVIILTEEDYRTEDLNRINIDIKSGINKNFTEVKAEALSSSSKNIFTQINDRENAIKKAISIATEGDIIVITGKGHEKSLARGNKEYPWNEKETIKKFLIK